MFNLDGFILKLCHLAQQMGDDAKIQHLRASGLQVLSAMVIRCLLFMSMTNGSIIIFIYGFMFSSKLLHFSMSIIVIKREDNM